MWLNLRKLIVRKAYLSGSQCRLSFFLLAVSIFFCESLAYSKDKRYNRNNSCHNCTKKHNAFVSCQRRPLRSNEFGGSAYHHRGVIVIYYINV